jgi:hypothetical protein
MRKAPTPTHPQPHQQQQQKLAAAEQHARAAEQRARTAERRAHKAEWAHNADAQLAARRRVADARTIAEQGRMLQRAMESFRLTSVAAASRPHRDCGHHSRGSGSVSGSSSFDPSTTRAATH